jgi:hypothetical protein
MYLFCYSIPLKELRADIRFHKGFRGVTKDFAVSLRPLNPLPRSHWIRWIRFCGLIETIESASAVSLKPPKPLLRSHWNHGIRFRSLIETAEADNLKQLYRISRRFRSHLRNGFSPWIRALGGDWWKRNRGSKISWHCPFKEHTVQSSLFVWGKIICYCKIGKLTLILTA